MRVMEDTLQVVEQKTVIFYADELLAIRAADGNIYVSVRHLCTALGLDRRGQVQRIQRRAVLAKGYQRGGIITPHRGKQQAGLLRVDLVPLWLSGIETSRVKAEIRPKLEKYQAEAGKVLWEAFQDGRLSLDPTFSELLKNSNSPSVQAYKMAQAIMQMAQQQILLESRIDAHDQRFDLHEGRIEQLESVIGDSKHHITPAQASQVSQAVKAVALELGKRSGSNEYGGVYGELYRRFGITSYKLLPKNNFSEAMQFLTDWYTQLTGDGKLPF
ncbi:MAG TPA: hypothetical protein ENJ56_05475 [Anaerolineae bacterium]|nr:hypothetical protein [Anaerolineae bacterium]